MFILVLSFASLVLLFSKSVGTRLVLVFFRYLRAVRLMLTTAYRSMPGMFRGRKMVKRCEEVEVVEEAMSVLDLPELALDSILERLSPVGLCNMSRVCSALKDRCRSDHLWGRHLREKWGHVIGEAAYMKWQCFAAAKEEALNDRRMNGLMGALSRAWPLSWLRSKFDARRRPTSSLPADSAMSWYLALESGKFWLPAQIYNRENGHSGFMLSCYDAELSYNWQTDTFLARYPPHGRRAIVYEDAIPWDRIRAPPVETSPHDLHASDCLNDLRPGDHIEIQWRRNKEFPYGWWYGVVGHLESCDGIELHCRCHRDDTVTLEFNHYAAGSRWRRADISRKDHREEGNETDGFYGGIRKLTSEDEISTWKRIWPRENLDQA